MIATVAVATSAENEPALRLYASLGFVDTAPYTVNPVAGARFMALELRA